MAWWIHDHLPYSSMCFFSKLGAFNIGWHEVPKRRIDSFTSPNGCLTKPGMPNHLGSHAHEYAALLAFVDSGSGGASPAPEPLGVVEFEPKFPSLTRPADDNQNVCAHLSSINYRAVHTKSGWRKARGHGSMHSAIYGKDGAAGLFAGKVRIDYGRHGTPLYVLVWQEGEPTGKLIRSKPDNRDGIELVDIPATIIQSIEGHSNPVLDELASFFR